MILWLTTMHENGLVWDKPFVFNTASGYFHGSEESRSGNKECEIPRRLQLLGMASRRGFPAAR